LNPGFLLIINLGTPWSTEEHKALVSSSDMNCELPKLGSVVNLSIEARNENWTSESLWDCSIGNPSDFRDDRAPVNKALHCAERIDRQLK
jgi:hypothetical protein